MTRSILLLILLGVNYPFFFRFLNSLAGKREYVIIYYAIPVVIFLRGKYS